MVDKIKKWVGGIPTGVVSKKSLGNPSRYSLLYYLPPSAPSHPIEIVGGPRFEEGVMITASEVHTIYTNKMG